MLKLGLIGDNIAASEAPRLHRIAGRLSGRRVTYDRLVPATLGREFDAVFDMARDAGYRGLNITYPYKERAFSRVSVRDPDVAALGAVNTVLFEPDGPVGWNTDMTGFMAAWRSAMGARAPGVVGMAGAGGVGRAIGFGLWKLGATEIRLFDTERRRAEKLAGALSKAGARVAVAETAGGLAGAEGIVNATPVGMVGHEGMPVPLACLDAARWAFDAIYTPRNTRFLETARRRGLDVIEGYELFFWQGVQAWAHFSGGEIGPAALRAALEDEAPEADRV